MATLLSESHKVADGANSKSVASIVHFIQQNCQYTLKPNEQYRVLQGILIGMLNIATEGVFCMTSALQETLEAVKDEAWGE